MSNDANYTSDSAKDLEVEDMAIQVVVERGHNRNERNRGDRCSRSPARGRC